MRLSTRLYGEMFRPKESAMMAPMPAEGGYGAQNAQPEMGAADATMSQINDYLNEMTAIDARQWRDRNIWADILIRRRMDALENNEWRVGPIDSRQKYDEGIVEQISELLSQPNPLLENNSFGGLWGAALDDMYTVGMGVVQVLLNNNMTARGFRALDAARLETNPKWDPANPKAEKRWVFMESFTKKIELRDEEVILLVPYMSTHSRTGLSPIKSLKAILQAELDARRGMHLVQKYRTPPGVFIMPGAAPGSPEKMRIMYDLKMAGKATIGFMNLPKDSKFVEFGGINLLNQGTFQFYEILLRATTASFGSTPFVVGWTDQDNRANSQTQLTLSDRGELTMLKFIRQIVNNRVIRPFKAAYGAKAKNLWFSFPSLKEEDELEDASSLRQKAGPIGFAAINEIRTAAGWIEYKKDDLGDLLYPFVSQPWVPSRIPGVLLPLKYAAMSWGIHDGSNMELLNTMLEVATARQPYPPPPEGEDVNATDVGEGEETGRPEERAAQVLRKAYEDLGQGYSIEEWLERLEKAARQIEKMAA